MGKSKYIPYGCQSIDEQDLKAVADALTSGWLTTGPNVDEFEEAVARLSGVQYGVAVSSGTAALHAAMFAFNIKEGDEVILPPMTFAATANCVAYMGATPVFADVAPDTLLIDPVEVEKKITSKTKGIIAVDYAGSPCDYIALRKIADEHGLFLAADACHSFGGKYNGSPVGSLADITTYSFHPVKHITTAEGGMAVTDNQRYRKRMTRFRNHGINADFKERPDWFYEMEDLGFNYRISDIQCALGLSQLNKLPDWVTRRRELAAIYDRLFAEIDGITPLGKPDNVNPAFHLYVVKTDDSLRREIFSYFRKHGIGVQVHYIPVHLHPFYKKRFNTHKGMCPVAEKEYESIISLPIFPGMDNDDINRVVETARSAIAAAKG
ncbi:UDP-4-amino-4,6-dideoxy-N-acetyl-beta-L-altrosamine transaminase [Maridesulfovibrio sp.]|uniref:UDP-4-amino-4, 6-dideoxy-N-acetyl-beta-L-altrosamine transaminase n=1 Tax=Maridesulfovibrio sp. TaxID=2795000 RepID=UPI003BAB0956